MKLATALILVTTALVTPAALRTPEAPEGHIEQLTIGEYWMGVDVTPKDLTGKVVLLEYWGS